MANGKEKLAKSWKQVAEAIFFQHPNWNAGQVHRQLIVVLGEGKAPASISSVQKVLPEWKKNYSPDRPWSLGAYIPQGDIMPLLSLQRQLAEHGKYLTVRRARWYAILYPAVSSLFEHSYPGDTAQNEFRIMQIASFYCRTEQIAEVNCGILDTTELDNIFLIGQAVGFEVVLREWARLFLPGVERPDKVSDTEKSPDLLSQFIKILLQSGADRAFRFVEKTPQVQPLAERWMVLSTRHDITNLFKKEGEK